MHLSFVINSKKMKLLIVCRETENDEDMGGDYWFALFRFEILIKDKAK